MFSSVSAALTFIRSNISVPRRIAEAQVALTQNLIPVLFLLLFYAIATLFQLYLGSEMMYEMRRKPELTLLTSHTI